ncbi:MAG: SgcJ/EcaC family oxidoreductase [Rhodocyclaceae bacterium]|nr:SgcJ/EcaC family oxidoreductase [Rhodocyclaceae bacterium]
MTFSDDRHVTPRAADVSPGIAPPAAAEAAVRGVLRELDAAVRRKDLDAVLDLYADDALLVMAPGRIAQGRDALQPFFEYLFGQEISIRQLCNQVLISGDSALLLARWEAVGTTPAGAWVSPQSVATVVLARGADGRWRLVIDNAYGAEILHSEAVATDPEDGPRP